MLDSRQLENNYYGFFQGEDERNNVVSLLKASATKKPTAIALQWPSQGNHIDWFKGVPQTIPHEKISFEVFYRLVQRTAGGLNEMGVKRGDCVFLFVPMSLYLYQAMAAIIMIGARAVFLDCWTRRVHLGEIARAVQPTTMISFEQDFELCADVPELRNIPIKIVVGPHKGNYSGIFETLQNSPPLDITPVEGEETALITFTTGSSGMPKGADRTHRFLVSQHLALNNCIPYNDNDKDLPAFPVFSLNNIANGINTVIRVTDLRRPTPQDPLMLVSQMESTDVTCATLSPSMIVNLAKYCSENQIVLPKIRRVVTGGAPISNDTLALFKKCVPNSKIWVLYGSTEVEPIAYIEATEILFPKHGGSSEGEGVNVGQISQGLNYRLIEINKKPVTLINNDWSNLEVGKGQIGELVVSGFHVCKSYYNNSDAVRESKIFESDGTTWHRTGDLARIDEHGNLWLVGRVHNAICRKGQLLFPVKVEILMKKHQDVKQAAYLGLPDRELGEKAYILVSLIDTPHDSNDKILKNLAEGLAKEKIPFDYLGIVNEIPMDPRHQSKVEYDLLRENLLNGVIQNVFCL